MHAALCSNSAPYELDEIRPWRASRIARDGNEHRDVEPAEQKECWLLLSISSLGAGSNSCIRDGSLTHFDLSIACASLEAWLRVYCRSVNDMAIVKIKPGGVIRTLNAVVHELTVRKRPTKMRTRVGHRKETAGATDEENWCALNHGLGWFIVG
jgi:hypothetical protein